MEKSNLTIPAAIVVAGALVAGALFLTRKTPAPQPLDTTNQPPVVQEINLRAVDNSDHILGNPDAEIKIVEYSDTECPFCKEFHKTMHSIIDKYGKDAKVAWVYRHFPLYKGKQPLHSKAGKEAEATECANELGGPTKFWQYIDLVYDKTPSNNGLDLAQLPVFAVQIGLDKTAFIACLDSGRYAEKVSASYDEAIKAGARGTPYSVVITKSGNKIPITGAQPYDSLEAVIETILTGSDAEETQ